MEFLAFWGDELGRPGFVKVASMSYMYSLRFAPAYSYFPEFTSYRTVSVPFSYACENGIPWLPALCRARALVPSFRASPFLR